MIILNSHKSITRRVRKVEVPPKAGFTGSTNLQIRTQHLMAMFTTFIARKHRANVIIIKIVSVSINLAFSKLLKSEWLTIAMGCQGCQT